MKDVIIKFEPFVLKQQMYIKDDTTGHVDEYKVLQKEIPIYLSLLTDIKCVHLFGNEKFVEKIKTDCITKFQMENVKFEINK